MSLISIVAAVAVVWAIVATITAICLKLDLSETHGTLRHVRDCVNGSNETNRKLRLQMAKIRDEMIGTVGMPGVPFEIESCEGKVIEGVVLNSNDEYEETS